MIVSLTALFPSGVEEVVEAAEPPCVEVTVVLALLPPLPPDDPVEITAAAVPSTRTTPSASAAFQVLARPLHQACTGFEGESSPGIVPPVPAFLGHRPTLRSRRL